MDQSNESQKIIFINLPQVVEKPNIEEKIIKQTTTMSEKLTNFESMDIIEQIKVLIEIGVDDQKVCNKMYDLLYEHVEEKKNRVVIKEVYECKKCSTCKRSLHIIHFSKGNKILKCCKKCRDYEKMNRTNPAKYRKPEGGRGRPQKVKNNENTENKEKI